MALLEHDTLSRGRAETIMIFSVANPAIASASTSRIVRTNSCYVPVDSYPM